MKSTAKKTIRSNSSSLSESMVNELMASYEGMFDIWERELESIVNDAVPKPSEILVNAAVDGLTNTMQAGISGAAAGDAVVGLPATGGLSALGSAFASSAFMSGLSALKGSAFSMAQRLDPQNFVKLDAAALLKGSILAGDTSGTGADGKVNWFLKLLLKLLGLDSVIDMIKMKISDGVETPRNQALNSFFNVLADGLPPWFWDVRIQDPVQGRKAGEEEDLKINDANPDDYNERRYNLGPLVYLPLIMDLDKVKTAENTGRGGAVMGLPDYDGNRNVMRAIGKARIYFKQPSDHWMGVNKYVITSSLLLPFWNVRNESLSYADKWGLMALDGLTNVISEVK